MALINCPECHREISDKAESCPHCGFPLVINLTEQVERGQVTEQIPHVKAKSGVADGVKMGFGMFIVLPILLGVALLAIFLLLGMCSTFI